MNNSNISQSEETVPTRPRTVDYAVDLVAIMRQIRLCRSTLGAILDGFECGNTSAGTIEKIADCTTGLTAEVESLWEATK
jgi:hypothetical protein